MLRSVGIDCSIRPLALVLIVGGNMSMLDTTIVGVALDTLSAPARRVAVQTRAATRSLGRRNSRPWHRQEAP